MWFPCTLKLRAQANFSKLPPESFTIAFSPRHLSTSGLQRAWASNLGSLVDFQPLGSYFLMISGLSLCWALSFPWFHLNLFLWLNLNSRTKAPWPYSIRKIKEQLHWTEGFYLRRQGGAAERGDGHQWVLGPWAGSSNSWGCLVTGSIWEPGLAHSSPPPPILSCRAGGTHWQHGLVSEVLGLETGIPGLSSTSLLILWPWTSNSLALNLSSIL